MKAWKQVRIKRAYLAGFTLDEYRPFAYYNTTYEREAFLKGLSDKRTKNRIERGTVNPTA